MILDLEQMAKELEIPYADLVKAHAEGVFDNSKDTAAEACAVWLEDPVAYVRDVFGAEPDEWQADALRKCVANPRVAMKACKGPGKSCVLAWFGWWCISLHPHANGFALSITADNLRDGLWKELALWYVRGKWLQREFQLSAERISNRQSPKTWWLSARSFPKDADATQQADTLAGLHAPEFVFILCDESSNYPDGVLSAAEGIFANVGVEAHLVQSGNPTRTAGPLYNACTRDRARWVVIEITGDPEDPKRSPRIDLAYAQGAIDAWGRDNPWVMVNILGKFPPTQENKLLGPDDMVRAEQRDAPAAAYAREAIIWGLDCARFGTDASVLRKRQGPIAFREHTFRNMDGPQLANAVSVIINRDIEDGGGKPDYIMVDVTGLGSSPFDHMKLLGWGNILIPVEFGSKADDERFADKRAEMWFRMATWIRKFGCLPSASARLAADVTAPTFDLKLRGRRTCFVLESKEDMKKRGLPSPDDGDSLALTFYVETPVRRDFAPDLGAIAAMTGKCVTGSKRRERRAS